MTERVRDFASIPLQIVSIDESLIEAQRKLAGSGVSALAVHDREPSVIGIVSRTDLLRAARLRVAAEGSGPVLHLPDGVCVGEVMGRDIYTVQTDAGLADAARVMIKHHVHRVLVEENGAPIGMLSASDLVRAAGLLRELDAPVGRCGHAPIIRIAPHERLVVAVDRLKKAHHQGLIVSDGTMVIGSFDADDALRASSLPADTRVDVAMNAAIACLDHRLPLYRAAQQLSALHVDRAVVTEHGEASAVVSATDVMRALAEAA